MNNKRLFTLGLSVLSSTLILPIALKESSSAAIVSTPLVDAKSTQIAQAGERSSTRCSLFKQIDVYEQPSTQSRRIGTVGKDGERVLLTVTKDGGAYRNWLRIVEATYIQGGVRRVAIQGYVRFPIPKVLDFCMSPVSNPGNPQPRPTKRPG